jgi:hypothetical protein
MYLGDVGACLTERAQSFQTRELTIYRSEPVNDVGQFHTFVFSYCVRTYGLYRTSGESAKDLGRGNLGRLDVSEETVDLPA